MLITAVMNDDSTPPAAIPAPPAMSMPMKPAAGSATTQTSAATQAPAADRAAAGVLFTGGAFFIWGVVPLYFRALRAVSAFEIIAHRVLWSVLFLVGLLALTRGFAGVAAVARNPRMLARLGLTSFLVTSNWLTFVWAVGAGRLLETSLGYFITPQVNVLLGILFLGERLRRLQAVAVALALAGVANQVMLLGQLPWISLVLAVSFGSYGLFRKQIPVDPIGGLLVETSLAAPFALAYIIHLARSGTLGFGHHGRGIDAMLVFLGVLTAVPLMMFAAGAQRLRLATVGFVQYLTPSMTFLLAIFAFGEPLGPGRALTFALIWAGVVVYVFDSWRNSRAQTR
jgi:chloramphenicol-sensitive protein RarD